MKIFFIVLIWVLAFPNSGFAQSDCTGGRYTTYNLFVNADVTNGVTFGNNIAVGGSPVDLRMDVYEPTGDTETNRPVIIMAFGGSFIGGTRADVAFMCEIFARMGYVAIAPDYRVGLFFPNQITTTLAILRGAHDVKACVRFLKKTVAEDGNPYGIDCGRIVVGGISSGAIAAIHAAYLDNLAEVPSYMANDTIGLGGVEGNSGSSWYPSDPLGVLSFSGAILDTSWIESGDVAVASIHEENDATVPFLTQELAIAGIPSGVVVSGSGDLHLRADNVSVSNSLMEYSGVAAHVGYLAPIDQAALDFATSFCADLVCSGETNDCGNLVEILEMEDHKIKIYPNPTAAILNFNLEEKTAIEVIDAIGRVVISDVSELGLNKLDVSALPSGTYTLRSIGEHLSTVHFIKE